MAQDKFFIAPYDKDSGLQNNVRPWLIPDSAFSLMNNAYVFRGRVRKRFGSRWVGGTQRSSRVRINVGSTAAVTGNFGPAIMPGAVGAIGQMFSVGTTLFTVYQANGATYSTGTATAIYNTATRSLTITGNNENPLTPVYFYPSTPIMGLLTYEIQSIENDPTIVFDTQFAYQYSDITGGFERLAAGSSVWVGSDSQFFWSTSWTSADASQSVFFVTNFDEADPNFMRYWDGATWTVFRPKVSNLVIGPPLVFDIFLDNARMLLVFKNRLIALNTWESESPDGIAYTQRNYVNRARYSRVGSPLDATSWRQDIAGEGNFIDAATTESIITAQFLKDRLIVFFEKSTWELVYQGNYAYPFTWQKINTELGAESTFSQVPFDKVVLGVDNVGIHACTGQNVDRIDDKIPNEVFNIHNLQQGIERVYGIRDYKVEMVYWTFPDFLNKANFPYPNRILVYNYKTGTWAFNDDSITAFGYIYAPPTATNPSATWSSTTITWDDAVRWNSDETQQRFRAVVAGNQQGFVFVIDADYPTNAPVLEINNVQDFGGLLILSIANHNLRDGDYIYIEGMMGTGNISSFNNKIYLVFISASFPNDIAVIPVTPFVGTYTGGGVVSRVSKIDIKTKEYNFYAQQNRNAYIYRVDFLVDKTSEDSQCAFTIDYYLSTSQTPLLQDGLAVGATIGNGTLETFPYPVYYPLEEVASRIWRPLYLQADGECIQLQITMSDEQMTLVIPNGGGFTGPTFVNFELHAMCFNTIATTFRLQ